MIHVSRTIATSAATLALLAAPAAAQLPPAAPPAPAAPSSAAPPALPAPPEIVFELQQPPSVDVALPVFAYAQPQPPQPPKAPRPASPPRPVRIAREAEELYTAARQLIDQGRFERAIQQLDRIAAAETSSRADAALYWKAYSQGKLAQAADALATLVDMQKRYPESRWLRDARALEVQIRQSSGQAVSPDAQLDDELKLLALRGLMQTDAERAVGMIEQLLAGSSSVRVKENALFVLSQSRLPRARDIIRGVAKGGGNPDLQLRAVRYLGTSGTAENSQLLHDVYRSSQDIAIKRAILRSFMTAGDRERLAALARGEASVELRAEAIQQLGNMRATSELEQLYDRETAPEIKRRILQAFVTSGMSDKLLQITRTEKDPELRRVAVRNLGVMGSPRTGDTLRAVYTADTDPAVRREVINALSSQQNAEVLVALARAEKDPAMKREIVSRLAVMKSKVAVDYMLELLK